MEEEEEEEEEEGSSEVGSSGEVGSSEVGSSGKGKIVREGRASASRRRGRCRQGGLWVLAIKAVYRSCHYSVCRQGGCGILLLRLVRVWGSLHLHRQTRSGFAPCLAGRSSQSIG